MIDYLEINRELQRQRKCRRSSCKPSQDKQDELQLDHRYLRAGYVAMFMFLANSGLSAVPIIQHALDLKTYTVLLTNILFIASNLQVYSIVNTKTFLLSYLTERQQFNDVDPDVIGTALADCEDKLVGEDVVQKMSH